MNEVARAESMRAIDSMLARAAAERKAVEEKEAAEKRAAEAYKSSLRPWVGYDVEAYIKAGGTLHRYSGVTPKPSCDKPPLSGPIVCRAGGTRACQQCGGPMHEGLGARRRLPFCSAACLNRRKALGLAIREWCAWCEGPIPVSMGPHAQYCSDEHRAEGDKRRRKNAQARYFATPGGKAARAKAKHRAKKRKNDAA